MKRKITLVVLFATCIILGYLSFIAWSVGFLLSKYLGGKEVGSQGKIKSYFIPLGNYRIHLHHWLLSSGIIIAFTVFKGAYLLPSSLVYGFFGAIVFHGIYSYNDWYKVLIPRHVQSLVVARNLMIEKITFVTHLLEMKQAKEEVQAGLPVSLPSSDDNISLIGDSGSVPDTGLHNNTA